MHALLHQSKGQPLIAVCEMLEYFFPPDSLVLTWEVPLSMWLERAPCNLIALPTKGLPSTLIWEERQGLDGVLRYSQSK